MQCGKYICFGAYANNMKCMYMYISSSGHSVDCIHMKIYEDI